MDGSAPDQKRKPKKGSLPINTSPVSPEKRLEYSKQVLESLQIPQQPPPGFDALQATPAELSQYGLSPRPDKNKCPQSAARWEQVMSQQKKANFVKPAFKLRPKNRTPLRMKIRQRDDVVTYTNPIWAGAIILDGEGDFKDVEADWIVPDPNPGSPNPDNFWDSDVWVGIDGWYSTDILQGGTSQDVSIDSDGNVDKDIYAFCEWYPAYPIELTEPVVRVGDHVYCAIWADNPTSGHFYIYNYTTGDGASVNLYPPNGYSLVGDCAEWIVEDADGDCLADFGQVTFNNCWALNEVCSESSESSGEEESDYEWENLADAVVIDMVEADGDEATAKIVNDTTLVVTYDG